MKKSSLLWLLVFCIFLSACGHPVGPPSAFPSGTSLSTATSPAPPTSTLAATATSAPTSTPIQTLIITPTFTAIPTDQPTSIPTSPYLPYPTKNVLFHYYAIGFHTYFEGAYRDYTSYGTQIILYSDGQLIIPGVPYRQKKLSQAAIDQFFAQLKTQGFYDLETDDQGHATEHLYRPDNPFERVYDDISYCVLTTTPGKRRDICAYTPYIQYLVPGMKKTLNFLDHYKPNGMTPYSPDRVLLSINSPESQGSSDPPVAVIPWPDRFPHLNLERSDYATLKYVQGNMAADLNAFISSVYPEKGYILFSQDEKEYLVGMDIVLPHEEIYASAVSP